MKHVQLNAIPLKDSTGHHLKTDRGQVSETGRHVLGQLVLPLILRPGGGRGAYFRRQWPKRSGHLA